MENFSTTYLFMYLLGWVQEKPQGNALRREYITICADKQPERIKIIKSTFMEPPSSTKSLFSKKAHFQTSFFIEFELPADTQAESQSEKQVESAQGSPISAPRESEEGRESTRLKPSRSSVGSSGTSQDSAGKKNANLAEVLYI